MAPSSKVEVGREPVPCRPGGASSAATALLGSDPFKRGRLRRFLPLSSRRPVDSRGSTSWLKDLVKELVRLAPLMGREVVFGVGVDGFQVVGLVVKPINRFGRGNARPHTLYLEVGVASGEFVKKGGPDAISSGKSKGTFERSSP